MLSHNSNTTGQSSPAGIWLRFMENEAVSDGGRRGEKWQEGIQRKMSQSQVVHYMLCCNTGICAPSDLALSPLTVKQPVLSVTAKPTTLPCTHPRLLHTTLCCPLCYRRLWWIYYLPPWTFCSILVINVSSAHMQVCATKAQDSGYTSCFVSDTFSCPWLCMMLERANVDNAVI